MVELSSRFLGVTIVKFQIKAFTLAELLITMLIFGILAVILVPNVTQNAEKQLFVTQLKKVQNDVQQALLVMMAQNQGSLTLFCSGNDPSSCFRGQISKKLENNVKFDYSDTSGNVCKTQTSADDKKSATAQACAFIARKPIYLNKKPVSLKINATSGNIFNAVYLKNGATVSVIFNRDCDGTGIDDWTLSNVVTDADIRKRICGYMEIDINAGKIPNTVGKDIHYFWIIDEDGIIPFGEIDTFTCGTVNNGKITAFPSKETGAVTTNQLGCTARMLQRNRIDYY